jgi:hypothetical protein
LTNDDVVDSLTVVAVPEVDVLIDWIVIVVVIVAVHVFIVVLVALQSLFRPGSTVEMMHRL